MATFEDAIRHVKNGGKAKRAEWSKLYVWARYITMGHIDETERMIVILVSSRDSKLAWMASPNDMITDDWILLE